MEQWCFIFIRNLASLPHHHKYTPCTPPFFTARRNVSFSISASLSLFSALTLYSHAHLWSTIQGTTNIDVAWRVWYDLCLETIRPFVPTRTVRLHSKKKGWMKPNLRRSCTKKRRLFNAARRSRSDQTWTQYKQIRNQCTTAINKAKAEYFEQKEADLASEFDGSHRWWPKAEALAKISSPKDVIPELACPDSGERASSDTKKANLLADFFDKQCTDRPAGDSGFANAAPGAPYPLPDGAATFTFPPISESLVLRKLLRFRPSKVTADSLFCNRFLQKCAPFLASSITFLFNLSLSTSSFPSAWKHAKVIPLYKHRGSQSDPSNYRPISLLPAIGIKVMDDIQSSRLLDFMTSNKLRPPGGDPGLDHLQKYFFDSLCFLESVWGSSQLGCTLDVTCSYSNVYITYQACDLMCCDRFVERLRNLLDLW